MRSKEELDLIFQYQIDLVGDAFKAFLNRDAREKNRVERHTLANLHRAVELRGETV